MIGMITALSSLPVLPIYFEQSREQSAKEVQRALEERACGPKEVKHSVRTDKKQHPTPEASPDKALVYVVRPPAYTTNELEVPISSRITVGVPVKEEDTAGSGVQTKLGLDGRWVGVNGHRGYFYLEVEPGEHYFCSQAQNRSVLSLVLESGKTYYLKQEVQPGFPKARNKLSVIKEADGQAALAECHLSLTSEKK